jgi:serine/threonine protein phosphatase PrpC
MTMRYATNYDIGDRKRPTGINEDSVALTVFEQGHREGYRGQTRTVDTHEGKNNGAHEGKGGDAHESRRGDANESRRGDGNRDTGAEAAEENGNEAQNGNSGEEVPANRSTAAFVLADGAGGHEAGDVASYIATTIVCEQLAQVAVRAARADPSAFDVAVERTPPVPSAAELREAIEDAINTAHRAIIANAVESGAGAYTTVVAGIVANGQVHYGWVGDSRAYVCNRERGTIDRLTKDHAVVEEMHDAGEVDEIEAHVHPRGNEITRALGGTPAEDPETAAVEVETETVPLYAEDTLLVTSDGLIDAQTDAPDLYDEYVEGGREDAMAEEIREQVVTDDEIRDVVLAADTLDGAATTLGTLTNDRGGKDNFSVLLLEDGTLEETPDDLPVRDIDTTPVEDRETRIVPGE